MQPPNRRNKQIKTHCLSTTRNLINTLQFICVYFSDWFSIQVVSNKYFEAQDLKEANFHSNSVD